MVVFVSYCPHFWGSELIYKAHDTQYMFERLDKKTHCFSVLGLFSWAIAHNFGVSEWFTRSMTLSTCLRGMAKTSLFLRFRAIFVGYCPLFWGSVEIYKKYDSLYILRGMTKNCRFCVYGRFRELLPTALGFQGDLQGPWHSVHVWEAWPKTRRFCVLGRFSWAIAHCLGVMWRFTRNITVYIF
jgi:hypothetical protein